MKKRWWVLVSIIVILSAFIWWWRMPHSSLKDEATKLAPEVEVSAVRISDIADDRIKLTSRIILSNPLPVELNTDKLDYEIFIDSVKVIQSSYTKPLKIGVTSDETIDVPMEILAEPMKRVLKSFEASNSDSATYKMKSSFEVDVPIAGNRIFKMEITRKLPAFRVPTGKLDDIDIHKLGFKESSLDMVLMIENRNIFPLKLKDGRYTMTIDKDLEMEGTMEKNIDIPPKSKVPISMMLVIKTARISKLAWKALFEKKDTYFELVFKGKLDTENQMLHNSNIEMNIKGTLDELKESKKKMEE
jgi:LEA14-like dessication related protein